MEGLPSVPRTQCPVQATRVAPGDRNICDGGDPDETRAVAT